ncbi:MAG: DUF3300 domain-containing protein [Rhodobacter sp.]|nr:DUF3300 domain-containing protein [Rhodobacter sp.]MCA3493861.1 DUF3300 domain-containing protein [Rhodobacter sp.]MCA3499516.1 DUF3300 domain-containing protein [Rhodobacter sp.]MCA3502782.1 DUF3300 domain-containing protein [Rhodobacter sp.]MCA3515943.1 DUF3300 domain-containing protein [Rhodobacter sp.]
MIQLRNIGPVASLLLATALTAPCLPASRLWAQEAEAPAAPAVSPAQVVPEDGGLLDAGALDELFAPVALYPDALLAQVLLAATYPLDVVKADLFLQKNAGKSPGEMSDLIVAQSWPEPVKGLAAGFPDLIGRMVEHLDWTEMAGNALIGQTDDSLAALQRLRAQARLNGYLEDNAAINVEETETGTITISSADSGVVYVPQYTGTVYTTPAPAAPYYVTDDDEWDDILATGVIVLGAAVILDEIFDDDWDNDWNGYWDGNGPGGGNQIDWSGDINIDNGINIGNGRIDIDREGLAEGGRLGDGTLGDGTRGDGNPGGAMTRPPGRPAIDSGRLGDVSEDQVRNARDGNFRPSEASQIAAREKIARQTAAGGSVATLPASTGKGDRAGKPSPRPAAGAAPKRTDPALKPQGNRSVAAKPNVSKPKTTTRPSAASASRKSSASRPPSYKPSSGSRAKASASRGGASRAGGGDFSGGGGRRR